MATLLGIALWLPGCATVDKPAPDPCLLDAFRDGHTKREAIVLRLGPPSRTMENERVLFYRLGQNRQGYFVRESGNEQWADVRYSLVLVLDEQGVLARHSLVNVR